MDDTDVEVPALSPEQARIVEIDEELAALGPAREEAATFLAECIAHSVTVAQSAVDQLRVRTELLLAEKARLTPPPPRDDAADEEAVATLLRNGWKENDNGTWTNTVAFNFGNTHVGAGVTRGLDEAAGLEAQRP